MLPPYGRPGVTSGAPTGSRARFWRRGDIHVARMTDAYTRVKRGQSLTRGRAVVLPPYGRPGVTSGAPTGSRRRFWRRGDIHVARMTDAYMRVKRGQSLTCGRTHAAMSCPTGTGRHKWRPHGVWRGSSAVGQGRRGDIHVARMTDATVADGFPGRTTDFRLQRLRCAVPAPGVTSGAPTECGAVRTNAAGRSGEGAARWMGGRPGPAREVRLSSRGRG